MDQVNIATSQADVEAAEAFDRHHAELAGALAVRTQRLADLAVAPWSAKTEEARDELVAWARTELLPHARAEEDTLYATAAERAEARLLVTAMRAEHDVLTGLVDRLAGADDAVGAAVASGALRVLFEAHLAKENDQLLPLLLEDPAVSVADLLGGMHELLAKEHGHGHAPAEATDDHHAGHTCNCGESDGDGFPELDARSIPHAIRHATIFGALDAVRPGQGLVLVAPHDPLPLLAQIEQRSPRAFTVDYLERGPEQWRLSFVRGAA